MQPARFQSILPNLSINPFFPGRAACRPCRRKYQGPTARDLLPIACLALTLLPGSLFAQEKLTPSNLPGFLKNFNTNFSLLDDMYRELAEDELPLRDDAGKPLGRRPIENRRQAISDLRQNALRLAADPQDLVLTATLVFKTENLADELYDLSQIAYDNGREELAKRMGDLQFTMDHNKEMLADYLLTLAAEKQDRIVQLEKEKTELERKMKEAEQQRK